VAGHFTYGVMAASAATFTFWSLYGTHILPPALYQGSSVSLALQLACSVLVFFQFKCFPWAICIPVRMMII